MTRRLESSPLFYGRLVSPCAGGRAGSTEIIRLLERTPDRLTYILANGVKEHLVSRVEEWPGVHSAHSLLTGEPAQGIWVDRTLARNLRLRRQVPQPGQVEIRYPVVLSQLPCWRHLTPEAYCARVAGLIGQIEAAAAAERAK